MSNAKENPVCTVQRFEPRPDAVYTLETAAHLAQVTRRAILVYYNHGLISPARDPQEAGYYFNDEAIRALQHIAFLRNYCGINLRGTRLIMKLMDEVERLQNELRFRRE
jgi:DNA-binding transcriptional MerR regulator